MTGAPSEHSFLAFLQTFFEARTGIHYGEMQRDIFADKAATRAREAGFDSLLDYYYMLRYDDPEGRELGALIDCVVVNESYLFREQEQLAYAVDHVLAPRVESTGKARVWSAACSFGEEPFTIAMLLADRGLLPKVEIVASDISDRALERARSGVVAKRAMRAMPDGPSRWLEVVDGEVRVLPEIRAAVDFRKANLVTDDFEAWGAFDAIFCRNVLIYFRDETVTEVARRLSDRLVPGGALFVGVSESLLRLSTHLACEERHGTFFYRKVP